MGTTSMTMCFKKDSTSLQGFIDVDLGGDLDNKKKRIWLCLHMGKYGDELDV